MRTIGNLGSYYIDSGSDGEGLERDRRGPNGAANEWGVMSERRDEIKRTKRARSDDRWSCNCCCLGREKKERGIVG